MSLFFLFLSLFSFLQKTAACRLLPLIFQCEIIAGRGICVHKSNAVNSHEFPSALLEKVTLEKVDFEFQSSDKANIYIAFSTLREGGSCFLLWHLAGFLLCFFSFTLFLIGEQLVLFPVYDLFYSLLKPPTSDEIPLCTAWFVHSKPVDGISAQFTFLKYALYLQWWKHSYCDKLFSVQ